MTIELPDLTPRGYRTVDCCGWYANGEDARRMNYASCTLSMDEDQRAAGTAAYAELERFVARIRTKADAERLLANLGRLGGGKLDHMKTEIHNAIYAIWFPNRYIGLR